MPKLEGMSSEGMRPDTFFVLMSQYHCAVVPLRQVVRDYFPHLTEKKLLQKALRGEIDLPIVRIEKSQKAARGIHIRDLAAYIDQQAEKARKMLG
jgi:hypothetical protein